jgi:hypothetical protein
MTNLVLTSVDFAGGTLEQFGELVRRIAARTFDPIGSPQLLVAWRPDRRRAVVLPIETGWFQSPQTKDALGEVLAVLGAGGFAMVAMITEGWYALPGSAASEEYASSARSLQEIREAGIEGVGELTMAWIADAETQACWTAEIEREAGGARLGRWELFGHAGSRWYRWFKTGIEFANREGRDA